MALAFYHCPLGHRCIFFCIKEFYLLGCLHLSKSLRHKLYVCTDRSGKKHHLVLEVAISSPKCRLSFVPFANSHPMVCTGKVELGGSSSPTQPVQQLSNQRQRVTVLDSEVIEASIIDTQPKRSVRLPVGWRYQIIFLVFRYPLMSILSMDWWSQGSLTLPSPYLVLKAVHPCWVGLKTVQPCWVLI